MIIIWLFLLSFVFLILSRRRKNGSFMPTVENVNLARVSWKLFINWLFNIDFTNILCITAGLKLIDNHEIIYCYRRKMKFPVVQSVIDHFSVWIINDTEEKSHQSRKKKRRKSSHVEKIVFKLKQNTKNNVNWIG